MSKWRRVALKFPDFKRTHLLINVHRCHDESAWEERQHISRKDWIHARIGNREIVGYGQNGEPAYLDLHTHPFPSLRFRELGPELTALREKEKGDWRTLTIDEKKCLYRASFCSTFAEMDAPDPEMKSAFGWALIWVSAGLWVYIFYQLFIRLEAPITFSPEHRIAQYYRAQDINWRGVFGDKNWPPPGAEPRPHPKNQKMLDELMEKLNAQNESNSKK